jgi:hypothetical protein
VICHGENATSRIQAVFRIIAAGVIMALSPKLSGDDLYAAGPDIAVRVDLASPVIETGDEKESIKVHLCNTTGDYIIVKSFDEGAYSSEEVFLPPRMGMRGKEKWGNVIAPHQEKVAYADRTLIKGEKTLYFRGEYAIPSKEFLKSNFFEVVGKGVRATGRFPSVEYFGFDGDRPIVVAKDPDSAFRGKWKVYEKTIHIEVAADAGVDKIRRTMNVNAFRKDVPWFKYIVQSDSETYLFPAGRKIGIGCLPLNWNAIGDLGMQFEIQGRATIFTNYNGGALKRDFSPKKYKEKFAIQKTLLKDGWNDCYSIDVIPDRFMALVNCIREDSASLLSDDPHYIYVAKNPFIRTRVK